MIYWGYPTSVIKGVGGDFIRVRKASPPKLVFEVERGTKSPNTDIGVQVHQDFNIEHVFILLTQDSMFEA